MNPCQNLNIYACTWNSVVLLRWHLSFNIALETIDLTLNGNVNPKPKPLDAFITRWSMCETHAVLWCCFESSEAWFKDFSECKLLLHIPHLNCCYLSQWIWSICRPEVQNMPFFAICHFFLIALLHEKMTMFSKRVSRCSGLHPSLVWD